MMIWMEGYDSNAIRITKLYDSDNELLCFNTYHKKNTKSVFPRMDYKFSNQIFKRE